MSRFISGVSASTSSVTHLESRSAQYESSAGCKPGKKLGLAGPVMGDSAELRKILLQDYNPLVVKENAKKAISHLRRYREDNLGKELGPMVQVQLLVDVESGVNDTLHRDGFARITSRAGFLRLCRSLGAGTSHHA
jgi:hypothetical protein